MARAAGRPRHLSPVADGFRKYRSRLDGSRGYILWDLKNGRRSGGGRGLLSGVGRPIGEFVPHALVTTAQASFLV